MLRTTEIKTAAATRISPRRLLVALLPVLALLVALAPASAMAGVGPITSSGNCTATVRTANNTSEVARISVDCRTGTITNVNLRTNGRNEGALEGDNGTTCDPDGVNREFNCQPGNDGSSISALFNEAQGEAVCLNPVLAVDFMIEFNGGTTEQVIEQIDNVEASGCSDSSGSGGSGSGGEGVSGEDDGTTPEGGVDSGAGGTAKPSDTAGVAGPVSGAALILLALASGGLLLRKTRTTP